jgi:hypothetical protein
MATHYDTLGASPDANPQQLRRAYLARARRLHPDQFVGHPTDERRRAERAMQELNAAWSVVSDPERRRAYDARLRAGSGRPVTSGTSRIVDGRSETSWRPYDRSETPTPPRRETGPEIADAREMEIRGTAKLLRPGALLTLFAVMAVVVAVAALVAGRGGDTPGGPAPVVLPTGTPIGCLDLSPVAELVPCGGGHDAIVWGTIEGGGSCAETFDAIYRPGVGGAWCVTTVG